MIIGPPHIEAWHLLTPANIRVRRLWGWGYSIQKILEVTEPRPRESGQLLIASDYGGDHSRSTHHIYCYLVVRGGGSAWMSAIETARRDHMPDGRKMSYKRLDDIARQKALIPFLKAAANLDGHLIAIAVDKKKKWLTTVQGVSDDFRKALQLQATWNARALESMLRKVHMAAILISIWSRPSTNVTWMTDEDEFVANDRRHDDALSAVARFCSFYMTHPMGVFRLNTTGQDPESCHYEDLCSIPDLAAGMLSEVSTRLSGVGTWGERSYKTIEGQLPLKAEVLTDWFWDQQMRLRKTLITIDVEGARFSVRKVSAL